MAAKKHTLAADEYTKIEPLFLISIFKIFKINYPLLPPGPRPCPPWAASKRLGGGWWGQRWRRPVKGFQKSTGRRFLNPVTSHLLCHPERGPRVMFRGHCPGASERLLAIIINGVTEMAIPLTITMSRGSGEEFAHSATPSCPLNRVGEA